MKTIAIEVDDGLHKLDGLRGIVEHIRLMRDAETLADWCETELGLEHRIQAVVLLRKAAYILEQRSGLEDRVRRVQTYSEV